MFIEGEEEAWGFPGGATDADIDEWWSRADGEEARAVRDGGRWEGSEGGGSASFFERWESIRGLQASGFAQEIVSTSVKSERDQRSKRCEQKIAREKRKAKVSLTVSGHDASRCPTLPRTTRQKQIATILSAFQERRDADE